MFVTAVEELFRSGDPGDQQKNADGRSALRVTTFKNKLYLLTYVIFT